MTIFQVSTQAKISSFNNLHRKIDLSARGQNFKQQKTFIIRVDIYNVNHSKVFST